MQASAGHFKAAVSAAGQCLGGGGRGGRAAKRRRLGGSGGGARAPRYSFSDSEGDDDDEEEDGTHADKVTAQAGRKDGLGIAPTTVPPPSSPAFAFLSALLLAVPPSALLTAKDWITKKGEWMAGAVPSALSGYVTSRV
jgi:hypothetical protein